MPETILVKKLETVADLTAVDKARLHDLCGEIAVVKAKHDIISEGARPE